MSLNSISRAKPSSRNTMTDDLNSSSGISEEVTLREIADRACKKVYIGTAVLPKPLFVLDHDDEVDDNDDVRYCCVLISLRTYSYYFQTSRFDIVIHRSPD